MNSLHLRAIQCAREVLIHAHISAGSRFQSSSRHFLMHMKKESEVLSEGGMRPHLILTRFTFIARSCLGFKFLLRYVFIFLLFSSKADLKHSCKICLCPLQYRFFLIFWIFKQKIWNVHITNFLLPTQSPSFSKCGASSGKGKEFRITNLTGRCVMIICFHLSSGIMCYGR